ncbi:MAG: hypothetical protein COY75_02035 [Nitrospirae bacterium CG_4_10_14_0_8_um_filter_41_23]|nr:hypothetical protein [Nitrospirota bacterium]OIP59482.1 MAG: hypothetical protein AUK38_05565 [Nitrospirae bacterium CG2_30_41_42]PIQ93547.1 MAG: hypothetical protein COV68_09495 [Nitrospirae bacterium CG11_big_fil_rev_8_21_14_0_20_41_14]PIV44735.1 MAG: hypothetical protein COS27_00830 [Nitrospirae bacterium CG02_land_8_20_14_3_00_41_53]PIW88072.1 MAG: hypothetical protein COZ94_01680 [Nitrospirae bacterium CG_4_8_14_3_um_filter_41_47]PIY87600.1 MAG: hypothetical protein COY75_02035 [Nitros
MPPPQLPILLTNKNNTTIAREPFALNIIFPPLFFTAKEQQCKSKSAPLLLYFALLLSHILCYPYIKGIDMLSSKRELNVLPAQVSSRKLEALKSLSKLGLKLSDGYDYALWEYASPETTLEDVRNRLSSIKTSLSEEIVEERNR